MFNTLLALVPLAVAVSASVPAKRQVDTTTYCGQWDEVTAGDYTLYLDQWGKDNADSGEACGGFTSLSGSTVAWENDWSWTGGSGVKSYTNVNLNAGIDVQLSSISSIPTSWSWSQSTEGSIVANIAYDLFTSSSAGGSNEFEIMVWMANFNAGPISETYNSDGTPAPLAEGLELAGITWDLYSGSNGANWVYSFLTSDGSEVGNFDGDLVEFLNYLTTNTDLTTDQYLVTVQAGSEATDGTADLTVSSYTISVA